MRMEEIWQPVMIPVRSVLIKGLHILGIWNGFEDAQKGGRGKGHREAAKATASLYLEWKVERLELQIAENVQCWDIKGWEP